MEETLTIIVKGEVVESNLPAYQGAIEARLAKINTSPSTDQEFGQAEDDWKTLKAVEEEIDSKTKEALKEAKALNELLEALSSTSEKVRQVRLDLGKAVKARKEEIRQDCVEKAVTKLQEKAELLPQQAKQALPALQEAVKGKRTIKSMNSAVDVVVMEWTGRIQGNRKVIEEFQGAASHHADLLSDRSTLEMHALGAESLANLLGERAEKARLRREKEEAEARERQARAEAEAVRKEQEEANEPPLPPESKTEQAAPAKATELLSPGLEWQGFKESIKQGFAVIKAAKEYLTHEENLQKAEAFAQAVNEAWKEVNA